MSTGATTKFSIPLFGDTDFVTPIQTPLNSQSNAMETAMTKGAFQTFPDVTTMNLPANVGTIVGQHCYVNADGTAANNGDYVWNGSAWVAGNPALPAAYICSSAGTQSVGTSFTLFTGYATPDIARGITQAAGVITVNQAGFYDLASLFVTTTNGVQSFLITKNSSVVTSGVILQIQQSGFAAYGARPVLLAVGDQLRWFVAAPATLTVQAASFISITYKSAR